MHSEIVDTSPTPDRRQRKHELRRDGLLDHAADLVDAHGVDGLTMSALAEAADYATASLYTYFSSRQALVTALQERALRVLGAVMTAHLDRCRSELSGRALADGVEPLALLVAFSDLMLTAPQHHPREFRLQQDLLTNPAAAEDTSPATVGAAMAILDLPRQLLARAQEAGALADGAALPNLDGAPVDLAMSRTLAWVAALNGTLLLDRLGGAAAVSGPVLGREVTRALLRGWGAEPGPLTHAHRLADAWLTEQGDPTS